jgi:hypothetical protein
MDIAQLSREARTLPHHRAPCNPCHARKAFAAEIGPPIRAIENRVDAEFRFLSELIRKRA